MINIKEMSREFNEVEQYLLTISPRIKSIKDLDDGTKIKVDGYCEFSDVKDDGTFTDVMSIITPDKEVYAFQSATFRRSLRDIYNIMHGDPFTIVKTSGKTKSGRDYVNCELDISSI